MGHLEEQFLSTFTGTHPQFFKRYIDDCIGVTTMSQAELDLFVSSMNEFHPSIKFTHHISRSYVSFLYITVSLSPSGLKTSIHYKDTDSHSFLLYPSSHPQKCKDSIPFSQLLRLRRICQDDDDFTAESVRMLDFFRRRQYPEHVLQKAQNKVREISRESALRSNRPDETETPDRPILVVTSHPHNNNVVKILKQNYRQILQRDEETKDIFRLPPLIAYRRDRNLRDILVRSRLRAVGLTDSVGDRPLARPCGHGRCRTCAHLYQETTIQFPGKTWHLRHPFSCNRRNLIYAIQCKRCQKQYVGETGKTLHERFGYHLRNIENNEGTMVAKHFNEPTHRGIVDVEIAVLQFCYTSKTIRKYRESELILNLKTLAPRGLNTRRDIIWLPPESDLLFQAAG